MTAQGPRRLALVAALLAGWALVMLAGCGSNSGSVTQVPPPSTRFLLVADNFASRVLVFDSPFSTGQSASIVLGQPGFLTSTHATTASGLYFPSKAIADSQGNIWVADTFNNRVLEYKQPVTNGMAANLVIGQADFTSAIIADPTQSELIDPLGLAFDNGGNLWVVDGANRVLEFTPPFTNGMNASLVLGQSDFTSFTKAATASGLYFPTEIAFDRDGNLWLVDSGNNRVLEYKPPFTSGESATVVLGQTDFASSAPATTATGLNSPYGVALDGSGNVWVSDFRNFRVLEFNPPFSTGQAATLVLGEPNFTSNGVSGNPQVDIGVSYGLAFDSSGDLFVSEVGSNRLVIFVPPFSTQMNATTVIGQQSFDGILPSTTPAGLSGPSSVSTTSF